MTSSTLQRIERSELQEADDLEKAVRLSRFVRSLIDGEEVLGEVSPPVPRSFRWAIIGGLAAAAHGRARATQDVDVLIDDGVDVDRATRLLEPVFAGLELHLMKASELQLPPSWKDLVFDTVVWMTLGGKKVPVASRDAVVALKLLRSDWIDLADIERILRRGGPVNLRRFSLSDEQLSSYREALRRAGV
jgi:hypothetical protein